MDPLQNQNQTTPPQPAPAAPIIPPPQRTTPPPVSPSPSNTVPVQEKHTAVGPIVGSTIIIIVLVLGALYFWGQRMNSATHETESGQTMQGAEHVEATPTVEPASDEVSSIDEDLKMESFTELEASISEIQ